MATKSILHPYEPSKQKLLFVIKFVYFLGINNLLTNVKKNEMLI